MAKNLKNIGLLDYFSVLVIGDNPDTEICKYDSMSDVDEPYIIYSYSDINKLRKNRITFYEEMLNNINDQKSINSISNKIQELKGITDEEYYFNLGELYSYDSEKNIITDDNPNGKWITCEKGGKIFSKYLLDFNGNGIISGKKSEIDWNNCHMRPDRVNLYSLTWELCVENKKTSNEKENNIFNNMKMYSNYFKNFKNKNDYVRFSCSFWTYAIIINGEWIDMENITEFEWISNFYDRFIKNLKEDATITIYECTK